MENRDWEKIAMKNKKIIIIVISIILILAISVGIGITIYFNNKPKNKPEDVLQTFASYINDKKYEDMYSLLSSKSKANISEEDFIKRNKNIYEGIEAENFSVDIQSIENENKLAKVTYKNSMDTMSGHVDFTNTVTLELNEEKEYKIDWTSNLIFPKLNTEDKVRVKTIEAKRGSILDRNGEYLATNGVASKIGLVPGKMSDNREEDIAKIAELLNMTSDGINSELSASYVKADTFVPLKTVGKNEMELKNKQTTTAMEQAQDIQQPGPETGMLNKLIKKRRQAKQVQKLSYSYKLFTKNVIQNPEYSEAQKQYLIRCMTDGMPYSVLKRFAAPNLSIEMMEQLRKYYEDNVI